MEFSYLPVFVKRLKELSRKYPSIKKDFANLLDLLQKYPQTGTPLGKDCYKIRLAIKSKNTGKSGGARVITCVKIQQDKIYFLTIYDKADQSTITDKDLQIFIDYINKMN
jgi:hypothetical protein